MNSRKYHKAIKTLSRMMAEEEIPDMRCFMRLMDRVERYEKRYWPKLADRNEAQAPKQQTPAPER